MIPFDFIYYRPDTLKDAVNINKQLISDNKKPFYYSGGSEIITMCRGGSIKPDAVIDIKNISQCKDISKNNKFLNIGCACTLNQIKESKLFPLLGLTCGRIADHTNQCRITLGGNICGTIIYRETTLPLLLCDADITVSDRDGNRVVPFKSVFDGKIHIKPSEMIVQVHVPLWAVCAKHFHIKRTLNEKIDYPVVTLAAIIKDNLLKIAVSGLYSAPFFSEKINIIINDHSLSISEKVEKVLSSLPDNIYSDEKVSTRYRMFVFKNTLESLLEEVFNDKV